MSCFFCSSKNHVSHSCNIYKSDEQRERYLRRNKCCFYCLKPFRQTISYIACIGPNCISKRKCFICFSRGHHAVFCPDRLKVLTMFSPNIDKDLLPRFLQFLTSEEKYLLCLSAPVNFKSVNLAPFKVIYKKEVSLTDIKNISNCNYFVAEKAALENNFRKYDYYRENKRIFKKGTGSSTLPVFRIQHLQINMDYLFSTEFLQLLSSKTRTLKCGKVNFQPQMTLQTILFKAPYLEVIDIQQTNVKTDNSWPDLLLQYNQDANHKNVHLYIGTEFSFNVDTVVTLLQEKYANISLSVMTPVHNDFDKRITKMLSNHFVTYCYNFSSLTVNIVDFFFNLLDSKRYELKDL